MSMPVERYIAEQTQLVTAIRILASVRSIDEARLIVDTDVDMIDLKDPLNGALGALSVDEVERITQYIRGRKPISATIGDLPMQPEMLVQPIAALANTAIDYIKMGIFYADSADAHCNLDKCLRTAKAAAGSKPLIAVILVDSFPVPLTQNQIQEHLHAIHQAGFAGVMLDTLNKQGKSLFDLLDEPIIVYFLQQAKALNLITGLSGALSSRHVQTLQNLVPDYAGFRSALCAEKNRCNTIEIEEVKKLVFVLHKSNKLPYIGI